MRLLLLAAAASAPLVFAAAPAFAQTTVSTSVAGPLRTSTTGDLTIAGAGTVTQSAAGAAVTVDSRNAVTNGGIITSTDVDNVTGIQLNGGQAGTVTNTGSITVTETYTAADTANNDGVVEAPFAKGVNKAGIRLVGPGSYTGDILHTGGAITVHGVNSYGISLEAPLIGNVNLGAPISLTGDNGAAFRETAGVQGALLVNGAISSSGQNSSAISLTGDVSGRVGVYSALVSSGYSLLSRPTTTLGLQYVQATPADLQQSASALIIGANVGGGVFLGAPPAGTVAGTTTTDGDGDGIADGSEGSSSIFNYGSAPAVTVGAVGRSVTLGNFDTAANAFGLIIRGAVTGSGIYDGVSATGLQLGVTGGGPVSLSGGLRVVGSIGANSYNADATALHILSGASAPLLQNEGGIASAILASTAAATSRAISIEQGANVQTLVNAGTISASAVGDAASVAAIVDRSGTLSLLDNSNTIQVTQTPTTKGDAMTGTATAIDLSANTTGVVLRQEVNGSGTVPLIAGDIRLGSGPNTVQLLGGSIAGALSLGSAAGSSILVDNGASYTGALSYGGTGLSVNVANGLLSLGSAQTLRLTSLNVGAASTVRFAIDAAAGTSSQFIVAGPATLATGAKIGLNLLTTSSTPQTFTLISATQPSFGTLDSSSLGTLPYLVAANLTTNPAAGTVSVSVRRRTGAELGLNTSEAPALNAIADGANARPALEQALLGQTTQAGFANTFRQLLPDRGEGVFRFAEQSARQVGEASGEADALADAGHFWVQQLVLGAETNRDASRERSREGGYGATAGYQTDQGPFGAFGVTGTLSIGNTTSPDRASDVLVNVTGLEGGAYWRARIGGLRLEASGGAGYLFIHGSRQIAIDATDTSTAFSSTSVNDHNGYTLAARAGASYQFDFGRYFARPQAHIDYFYLNESGYAETGGGAGVDLTVGGRTGSQVSGTGSMVVGARFGDEGGTIWRPSLEVGARDIFSGDTGSLAGGYGATTGFVLSPLDLKGTNTLAKLKLSTGGKGYDFDFEAAGEQRERYYEGALRAVARLSF